MKTWQENDLFLRHFFQTNVDSTVGWQVTIEHFCDLQTVNKEIYLIV